MTALVHTATAPAADEIECTVFSHPPTLPTYEYSYRQTTKTALLGHWSCPGTH